MQKSSDTIGHSKHRKAQRHSKYGVRSFMALFDRRQKAQEREVSAISNRQQKRKLQAWTESIRSLFK